MYEFYPLLLVGGVVGVFAIVFLIAYLSIKDKKAAIGYDRNMKDSEIARRLLVYAKPYTKNFIFVLFIMLFSKKSQKSIGTRLTEKNISFSSALTVIRTK